MMAARTLIAIMALLGAAVLAGCSTSGPSSQGGYYKDDGPGSHPPADIDAIPDAVPRIETHARANSRPYKVFGKTYVPVSDERPFRQKGIASWYGRKFHGAKTANGETYDMYAMTAAHPTLPIPSYARVTRVSTGKSVVVRINDRGPFHSSRIIDLSYAAASKLGLIRAGSGQVIVEAITNQDIARGLAEPATAEPPAATAEPVSLPATAVQESLTPPDPITPPPTSATAGQPTPNALAAVPVAATPSSSPGQVFLQFGAFSGQENAQSLAHKLNAKISRIESREAHVDAAGNLYRVQIGPYPNRTAAVNAALRIQQETGTQPALAVR